MINLVIGNTSQQSYYYPDDYMKISSRNIDLDYLKSNKFDSVYITFAEQSIYDKNVDYISPNYTYTMNIVNSLIDNSNKITIFTSCELWSNKSGVINNDTEYDFNITNQYTLSKLIMINEIKRLRQINSKYNKVVLLHPFYFNSAYRSKYFLFGKIFDSILNKNKIEVGNLNFYRDMVHAKFLVEKAIELNKDSVIGSGRLFNVRDFIIDLYSSFNLDFFEFVKEDHTLQSNDKNIRAQVNWSYTYENLLSDTINDLKKFKKNDK